MSAPLAIDVVVSPMFGENCFIARLPDSSQCVVVDPGLDPEAIQETITNQRLSVHAILNTHGHADHIAGNEFMKRCWPDAPLVIGTGDEIMLSDPVANLSSSYGMGLISPPADQLVDAGDEIEFAGIRFAVRFTPGHSPGHVVFLVEGEPNIVFGGDVLFRSGIGRTDFPTGSFEQLASSIRNELYTLPDDTVVLPGHGPETTVGIERKTNPFVRDE